MNIVIVCYSVRHFIRAALSLESWRLTLLIHGIVKPTETCVVFTRDTPTSPCELLPSRNTYAYPVTVKVIQAMKAYDGPGGDTPADSVLTQRKNINLRGGGGGEIVIFRRV
jgi:hypothetical protein